MPVLSDFPKHREGDFGEIGKGRGMLQDIISGFVSLFQENAPDEDRRKVIRLRCRYSVYMIYKKQVLTCTAVDMGLQGIRLDMREKVKPGTRVALLYRGAVGQKPVLKLADVTRDLEDSIQNGVRCAVLWCQQNRYSKKIQAGLRYADSPERMSKSWVKKILREIGFDEETIFQRRKIIRVAASLPYEARSGETRLKGVVINLGAGGALIQSEQVLPDILELAIGPYKNNDTLCIRGRVVTRRHEPHSNIWLNGIRFGSPSQEEVELLGKYVVGLLKDNINK